MQFQVEPFNSRNRPKFSAPGTNLFDDDGIPVVVTPALGPGVINDTPTSRQIQFLLRLSFWPNGSVEGGMGKTLRRASIRGAVL